jgi:large subunit ribosomal protein L31
VTNAHLAQKSFTSLYLAAVAIEELTVKADLHPMYRKVMAVCACGNQFETRSTAQSIHVEVCAQCHPYFTGKQRLVDTAGRVDRFRRKYKSETAAAKA